MHMGMNVSAHQRSARSRPRLTASGCPRATRKGLKGSSCVVLFVYV